MLVAASTFVLAADVDVRLLFEQLNDDRYEVRQLALEQLDRLANEPANHALLAATAQPWLYRLDTPLETRQALQRLSAKLPRLAASAPVTAAQIDELIAALDSQKFSERLAADEQFKLLVLRADASATLLDRLLTVLEDGEFDRPLRQDIEQYWESARQTWLADDERRYPLMELKAERLTKLVEQLVSNEQAEADKAYPIELSERQLRLHLAHGVETARIATALQTASQRGNLSDPARARLDELLQWTKPAMVAEFWDLGKHGGIQHLLVDVPSQAPGAVRPSHFDRIDDRTAHCVSGNTLEPGDYPVGEFFPHPHRNTAAFHLVNLPTARARLAYEPRVKRLGTQRLAEISARTLSRWLERGTPLSLEQLRLLAWFDPEVLSRQAPRLLAKIDDVSLGETPGDEVPRGLSHHGVLCLMLARRGTIDAAASMIEALDDGRVLKQEENISEAFAWLSVLTILNRARGAEADRLLVQMLGRRQALFATEGEARDLGASAAALLLQRYDQSPESYGLKLHSPPLILAVSDLAPLYSSESPTAEKKVRDWWTSRASRP